MSNNLTPEQRDEKLRSHMRFLHGICLRYQDQIPHGQTYDDLFSVALVWLDYCLQRWDENRVSLIGYSRAAIHRKIREWINYEGRRGFTFCGQTRARSGRENDPLPTVLSGSTPTPKEHGGGELLDSIADREPSDAIYWTQRQWRTVICKLKDRRLRIVIEMFYRDGRTHQEISAAMGISKTRFYQLQQAACRKLRHSKYMKTLENSL